MVATILLDMPEIQPKKLGAFIAHLRDKAGLSQQDLADRISNPPRIRMDGSGLSRRESGERQWKWSELEAIARAFQYDDASDMLAAAADWADRGVPVLGTVPASSVIRHWQFVDDPDAAEEFIPRKSRLPLDTYALRVVGDSMSPLIPDGSYVYCRTIPADAQLPDDQPVVAVFGEDAPHPGVCLGYMVIRDPASAELIKTDPRRYPSVRIDLSADPPHLIGLSVVIGKFTYDDDANQIVEQARREPKWEVSRILDPELTLPPGQKQSDKARKKPRDAAG